MFIAIDSTMKRSLSPSTDEIWHLCIWSQTWKFFRNTTFMHVEVKNGYSIEAIKAKICEEKSIPIDQQRLVFRGNTLENHCTLADYKITLATVHPVRLYQVKKITVLLGNDKYFTLEVDVHSTIAELKDMIKDKEGIPPDQQKLIAGLQELNCEHMTLDDYSVEHEGTVAVVELKLGSG